MLRSPSRSDAPGLLSVMVAAAAIDIALWDLEGRRRGEPLWRLLGGHRRKVPAYAGGIDLYFTLDALREQTRGFLDRGFGAIKMKVGRERLSEDTVPATASSSTSTPSPRTASGEAGLVTGRVV